MFAICGCLLSCQNGEDNSSNQETNTPTEIAEKVGDQKKVSTSNIKSFKEIKKQQQQAVKAKKKAAEEKTEQKLSESFLHKQKVLEKGKSKNPELIKQTQPVAPSNSTKERILNNLKKSNIQQGGEKGVFGPSKDFMMGTRSLFDMGLKIVKLGKRPVSGYERFTDAEVVEERYAYVSLNNTWAGPLSRKKGENAQNYLLEDVHVFEAVYKAKEMEGEYRHDLKITEIQFPNDEAASNAAEKIQIISNAISEYPKHINTFWQDENRFYIVETRAAMFQTTHEKANKAFYMTVTSSK